MNKLQAIEFVNAHGMKAEETETGIAVFVEWSKRNSDGSFERKTEIENCNNPAEVKRALGY